MYKKVDSSVLEGDNNKVHVDVIDTYDAFRALKVNWNSVYVADSEALFFLSWPWLAQVFEGNRGRWKVLAVKSDVDQTDYVGFLPVSVKTIWSKSQHQFRNELHMAGTLFWSQYTGFVCHPDWEDHVVSSLAEASMLMRWSRLSLKYIYASKKRLAFFIKHFPTDQFRATNHTATINQHETNNFICPYVELPGDFDTYLQTTVSSKSRQKIRQYAQLVNLSADLTITTTSIETIERDLDILVSLWQGQRDLKKDSKANSLVRKYRRILQHSFTANTLRLSVLWRGDTPLAAHANLVDWQKHALHFFVSGRDESQSEPSIDWVLHAHDIRWAIRNGFKTYDFGHGNEPYKYSFGATEREVKHVTLSNRSGLNLHGLLEPSCVAEVEKKLAEYEQRGLSDRLQIVRKQLDALSNDGRK